jgi:hypothetical protein
MTTQQDQPTRCRAVSSDSIETAKARRGPKNKAIRAVASAGILAGALVMAAGGPVGRAPTAAARAQPLVTGLEKKAAVTFDTRSSKQAFAYCDPGQVVVGGGGWAFVPGSADDPNGVTLWQLQPAKNLNGTSRQGYAAGASEVVNAGGSGVDGAWWVEAYALCADPITGHRISESANKLPSSTPVQKADAFCDTAHGERVLGTGARVLDTSFQVGLQVARVDALGGIARAQAHEDASGYPFAWRLKAYAICAPRPQGYEIRTGASKESGSEPDKDAHAGCSSADKQMLGAGAAITDVAPGHVSLQQVYPRSSLRSMDAWAVENTPLFLPWDFIIARGVCVDAP